jgi:hypothetical protein
MIDAAIRNVHCIVCRSHSKINDRIKKPVTTEVITANTSNDYNTVIQMTNARNDPKVFDEPRKKSRKDFITYWTISHFTRNDHTVM